MKIFQIIFMACCMSSCALKFVFSESAGYISGWERKGFFSVLYDKKIRFLVNNSYTAKSSEVLFGVEHSPKNFNFSSLHISEAEQFIITAFFDMNSIINFEKNYRLIINGKTYEPIKVIVGDTDKNIYSCLVNETDKSNEKEFISVGNNQCMLFVFAFKVPPPEQVFNLKLVMVEGNVKSKLDVAFTNRQRESTSTY